MKFALPLVFLIGSTSALASGPYDTLWSILSCTQESFSGTQYIDSNCVYNQVFQVMNQTHNYKVGQIVSGCDNLGLDHNPLATGYPLNCVSINLNNFCGSPPVSPYSALDTMMQSCGQENLSGTQYIDSDCVYNTVGQVANNSGNQNVRQVLMGCTNYQLDSRPLRTGYQLSCISLNLSTFKATLPQAASCNPQ